MAAALIVAHGSPGDPEPQEVRLRALAGEVEALLPGWRVVGATLAAEGALETAIADMPAPVVYPFFMANGWFTGTNLPRRLAAAGARGARQVAPFGADPDLPGLMARVAVEAAGAAGLLPGRAALLLAAHGSQVSRRSADTTHGMARMLAARTPFARVTAGFVEESPRLVDAARGLGPGVCLPFFALRAGHVEEDVPQALAEAGFDGPLLPPIGEHAGVPGLIARALLRAG